MASFGTRIRPYVTRELEQATAAERDGDFSLAFEHLERAHVLGQTSTREHVRVYWEMLRWGAGQGELREVAGQILRLIGASTLTALGFVPSGNTGGSNISAFRRVTIPEDLLLIIEAAHGDGSLGGDGGPTLG